MGGGSWEQSGCTCCFVDREWEVENQKDGGSIRIEVFLSHFSSLNDFIY